MSSDVHRVSTPTPGSKEAVIWLPWQDWQFAKRDSVPRILTGGQSPQSPSAMSEVTACQPRSARVAVLQNHASSCRE